VDALRFIFRAVTPAGRPRRFDARFFTADSCGIAGDPDDFSRADAELADLRWFDLAEARALPLPFITGIVLSELAAALAAPGDPRGIPYFHHTSQGSRFRML
jgi:8-oxo-dGTP pyrophosphatase MutT (NUDIX family)